MISYTRHFRFRRSFHTLGVVGCVVGAFSLAHTTMASFARIAETELGAYTWWQEEYLQLLTPSNYIDRGADRVFMYGPSESREAFIPEVFNERLPKHRAYQHSQSIGTIEDGLVVLDYIEQAYGDSATPKVLLFGITTRFISNIRNMPSPLYKAINRYSPEFRLDDSGERPNLVRRGLWESLRARFAFLCRQQQRYRSTIRAFLREAVARVYPNEKLLDRLRVSLTPSKYHHLSRRPIEGTKQWLVAPGSFWEEVHAWEPEKNQNQINKDLTTLIEFARRHGSELYIVNMPELSWNRILYPPGQYESYLAAVKDAIRDTPFLDLRTFLSDDSFYDSCHPTLQGSIEISQKIAEFIAQDHNSHDGRAK